jgi:hypothetical protein
VQRWTYTSIDLRREPPPPSWGVTLDADALGALADRWRHRPLPLPTYDMPGIDAPRDPAHWFDFAGCPSRSRPASGRRSGTRSGTSRTAARS